MSKHYKKRKDSNAVINTILIAFLLFVLTPVIPITALLLCVFYLLDIKGKYPIWVGSIALLIIFLFFNGVAVQFTCELSQITMRNWQAILQVNFFETFFKFQGYTFSSYVVMFLISLVLTGYFLARIQKNKKFEDVGIKPIGKIIDKINKSNDHSIKSEEKQTRQKSTLIGYTKNKKQVFCADNARHIFICGTTGSGKTVAILNYVKHAIEQNYGLLIIDGKGDIDKNSLLEITRDFCNQYNKKQYVIDMNNPSSSAKYNPFNGANETVIKDMIINMTEWSEPHYKVNTERYIQRLIKLLKLADINISLQTIIDYMSPENFLELSNDLAEDEIITKKLHLQNTELVKAGGKIAQDSAARFATLAESELGAIFTDEGIDIYSALSEGAVITVVLNPLLYPETSAILGRLILIDAKQAISKLFNNKLTRTFFVFDEIATYVSKSLVDIVNKGRSAGITAILAAQSLADLESVADESLKNQIIENCNNYLVMRQNAFKSAEEWSKTIGTMDTMKMTYQLNSDENEDSEKGSIRNVKEFIVHPDEIKNQKLGEGVFLSRDTGKCERIHVVKPF